MRGTLRQPGCPDGNHRPRFYARGPPSCNRQFTTDNRSGSTPVGHQAIRAAMDNDGGFFHGPKDLGAPHLRQGETLVTP